MRAIAGTRSIRVAAAMNNAGGDGAVKIAT
jgi:hypothetical protein